MAKFRKRPVVIEAWQWLFNDKQEPEPVWIEDAMHYWPDMGCIAFEPDHPEGPRIAIATMDAVVLAFPGDWICKDVKGELYPCKPDIFDATYELLVDGAVDISTPSTTNR